MSQRYFKMAVIYLTAGVILGLVMGIRQDFRLASVHAHINLLGWVSMAIFALIYRAFPIADRSRTAAIQFWLHNIGLPLMQGAIATEILTGSTALLPLTIVGSLLIVASVILMLMIVFQYVGPSKA